MKKTYIIPCLLSVSVETDRLFATSPLGVSNEEGETDGLVKGENAARSNYNVWDDDWSK